MAVDFAAEEAATLKRWREIDAFQTQMRLSKGNKPYTFYDGPVSLLLSPCDSLTVSDGSALKVPTAHSPPILREYVLTVL